MWYIQLTKPGIYSWIIDDVVEKMNQKFAEVGLDQNILTELKEVHSTNKNWEKRIRLMKVAPFPALPSQSQAQFPGFKSDVNYYPDNGIYGLGFPQVPQNDGTSDIIDREILGIPQLDGREDDDDEEEEVYNFN